MTIEDNDLTSRDYAREANHTRRRLAESLDELNDRLTPGQIFDEVLSYTRGGSGTFLRGLSNAAKENPIPSLLIGTGCMLFLSEKMGFRGFSTELFSKASRGYPTRPMNDSSRMTEHMSRGRQQSYAGSARSAMHSAAEYADDQASRVSDFAGEQVERVKSAVGFAGEQMSGAADDVLRSANSAVNRAKETLGAAGETISDSAQRAKETVNDIRDKVADGSNRVVEAAQGTAQTIGAKARDYSQTAGEQFSAMQQQASEAGRRATDRTTAFVNEQPLLVAAIGLAVGAAFAALLPPTRTEDELMGSTSDAVKKAAGSVASEQLSQAKSAAGRVADEAANIAEREGLTVSAAVDAVKQVNEKVKHVVAKTAQAGKSELKDLTKTSTH